MTYNLFKSVRHTRSLPHSQSQSQVKCLLEIDTTHLFISVILSLKTKDCDSCQSVPIQMEKRNSISGAVAAADEIINKMDKKPIGPISIFQEAQNYIKETKVPELFRSLIAALMVERPQDPHKYLDGKLEEIKIRGMENIDWETFVHDLHPTREKSFLELVNAPKISEKDKGMPQFADEDYEPQLFQLTETSE